MASSRTQVVLLVCQLPWIADKCKKLFGAIINFSCADLIKLECEQFHIGEKCDDAVFSKEARKEVSVFYHRRALSSVDNGADYNFVLIDVKVQ